MVCLLFFDSAWRNSLFVLNIFIINISNATFGLKTRDITD